MDNLPFLYFGKAQEISFRGRPMPIGQPAYPSKDVQIERISPQLQKVEDTFNKIAFLSQQANLGMEPEAVLIMEIAGSIQDFKQALEEVGLEWLAEWDEDPVEPDENFYWNKGNGEKSETRKVATKLFVSMANQAAMQQMQTLWRQWQRNDEFVRGTSKWKNLFQQLINIRTWGPEESVIQTGMYERWYDLVNPLKPEERVCFQIDLFYFSNAARRRALRDQVEQLLERLDGKVINELDIQEIRFHALKAELPSKAVVELLESLDKGGLANRIDLLNFPGIMYFKPTGQTINKGPLQEGDSLFDLDEEECEQAQAAPLSVLLDGLPLAQHQFLKDNLIIDDVLSVAQHYQQGEQLHGTTMASLIINDDLNAASSTVPNSLIAIPILQPDIEARSNNWVVEHVPDDCFIEERVLRAIEHLFQQKEESEYYANVCFVNFSIGLFDQVFHSSPSPLARLIDWLSYQYNLLFFISAGNYLEPIELGMPFGDWKALSQEKQLEQLVTAAEKNKQARRLISPAESINAITVGGIHADELGINQNLGLRIDPLSDQPLPSLVSRIGYGFKQAIKPEIYLPAGRQLFNVPLLDSYTNIILNESYAEPGHKVALPSKQQGDLAKAGYTRGTSNANALATRSAQLIHNHLESLSMQGHQKVPHEFMPVVIKTLLVHGARQSESTQQVYADGIKSVTGSNASKKDLARYLGYGTLDINWLLRNTQQKATVIGWGEIGSRQIHEYKFPLPEDLSGRDDWRRLTVTLAWLSPVNANHANYREVKLELDSLQKWGDTPVKLQRTEQDYRQVKKGTVQHEVLESSREIEAFQQGEELVVQVVCKPDGTSHLDVSVPYSIAVTLEVKQDTSLRIYQQIQQQIAQRITPRVQVR